VNQHRWLNQTQPQTLVIGTVLLYLDAVFNVLGGLGSPILLLIGAAMAAGGYGIANEHKWGYAMGAAAAVAQLLLLIAVVHLSGILGSWLIDAIFDVALVALLLHPDSRDYQRIWFK